MSIQTLTLDEFMRLSREDHQEALDQYDKSISDAAQELVSYEVNYDQFAEGRDKLGRLLTLRKLHQGCLDELETPAAPVSQQYFNNELDQLPS